MCRGRWPILRPLISLFCWESYFLPHHGWGNWLDQFVTMSWDSAIQSCALAVVPSPIIVGLQGCSSKPKQNKVSSCLGIPRPRVFLHFFEPVAEVQFCTTSSLHIPSVFWLIVSWLLPKPSRAIIIPLMANLPDHLTLTKASLNNCLHVVSSTLWLWVSTSPLIFPYILYLIFIINPILWSIQL